MAVQRTNPPGRRLSQIKAKARKSFRRWGSQPLYDHYWRVGDTIGKMVKHLPYNDLNGVDVRALGFWHDAIEDKILTMSQVPAELLDFMDVFTRREKESSTEHAQRKKAAARECPYICVVALADALDNAEYTGLEAIAQDAAFRRGEVGEGAADARKKYLTRAAEYREILDTHPLRVKWQKY